MNKYFKVLVLILLVLLCGQWLYFGTDDCGRCNFGGDTFGQFLDRYEKDCFETIDGLNFSSEINGIEEV